MADPKEILLVRPMIGDMLFEQPNPPVGLGYLAAVLEQNGFKAIVLDMAQKRITIDTLVAYIARHDFLFVGITALTCYYNSMRDVSRKIKVDCPSVKVVLGGVHVSSLPELSLRETGADVVVIGEGERTIVELANSFLEGNEEHVHVHGIACKKGNEVIFTPQRDLIQDLDEIPFPAWQKITPAKYPPEPHGYLLKHRSFAPVMTTRGCPFTCHYCSSCSFWRKTIRFRSAKNVVDEIEHLHAEFGIKEIHFWDDNLTLSSKHITAICMELLRRNLHVACSVPNGIRVDTLNERVLKLMKQAGFYYLIFAVESGSPKTLRENGKNTNLKTIIRNTFIAKKVGFILGSYFMMGFPGESIEDIKRSVRLAKSLPFHMTSYFIVKPLPGSEMFGDWARGKDMTNFDWHSINFFNENINVSSIDGKLLKKIQVRAALETVSNLFSLLRFIEARFIKYFHWYQLKVFLNRIIRPSWWPLYTIRMLFTRVFHPPRGHRNRDERS